MQGLETQITDTYLLAKIDRITLAIPASKVMHIGQKPSLKQIPQADEAVFGVMQFRERVISVIDLRTFLGLSSILELNTEMVAMLERRKQDHIDWLKELERCIESGDEFTLALDPKACKFGKWFYSFKTEDKSLQMLLNQFELPHNTIHGIAQKAIKLLKEGSQQEAMELIQSTREHELATMLRLFEQFEHAYTESQQSLVVVTRVGSDLYGLLVDSVQSVQRFEPISKDEHPSGDVSNALKEYGNEVFLHNDKIVYELLPERVMEQVVGFEQM
jgi:chemotaxis signal transduction protein